MRIDNSNGQYACTFNTNGFSHMRENILSFNRNPLSFHLNRVGFVEVYLYVLTQTQYIHSRCYHQRTRKKTQDNQTYTRIHSRREKKMYVHVKHVGGNLIQLRH